MSSKDIVGEEKEEGLLMTEKRKYPEVFKWKIAVIVIVVLIAIILVVDLIMFLYLKNHQLRKNNFTFAAEMINLLAGTSITKTQFVNLIGGLTKSYTDIWFQQANKVASWSANSGDLTLDVAATFFSTKVTDRITLIQFNNGTTNQLSGAFTHIPFQLPTDTWKDYLANANNSYYNFEIDAKESTMFGSNSETFIKMDGSADNLANCRVINLNQVNLNFLLGADIRLTFTSDPTPAQIRFLNSAQIQKECFSTNNYDSDFLIAVGPVLFNTYYDLVDISTYQLTT